jgi:hypothetical protein
LRRVVLSSVFSFETMPSSERGAIEDFAACRPFGFEKDQVASFFPRLGGSEV